MPFDELVAFCREPRAVDVTLIEGIGGVMVPLDDTHTVLDWLVALEAPDAARRRQLPGHA